MLLLKKIWELLKGKKTYIVAILLGSLSGLKAAGLIPEDTYQLVMVILGALGFASLKSGQSESEKRLKAEMKLKK